MTFEKIMLRLSIALIIVIGIVYLNDYLKTNQGQSLGTTISASPTPTPLITPALSKCHVNGPLPDSSCTPGAIFPTATVAEICTPGYSAKVRDVPESLKKAIYEEYGVISHTKGQYEVDHLISLELGGSNDPTNLWPEIADPTPGFHQKDVLENYLHQQVCAGLLSLADAQKQIASNWLVVYDSLHL